MPNATGYRPFPKNAQVAAKCRKSAANSHKSQKDPFQWHVWIESYQIYWKGSENNFGTGGDLSFPKKNHAAAKLLQICCNKVIVMQQIIYYS